MSGPTYTPSKSTMRDQVHADLLRLSNLINAQALTGSPEGVVAGTRGDLVIDTSGPTLWIKTTGTPGGAQSTTGWSPIGGALAGIAEFGSVGWVSPFLDPAVTQTGSGDGLVDIVGSSTLEPAEGFESPGDNQLQYQGAGGRFFVESDINIRNGNAEEAPFGFQLMLNGSAIEESQRTIIMTANAIIPVSTHVQASLATGDILSAQVGNLQAGAVATDATYFRLQAHRVGPL